MKYELLRKVWIAGTLIITMSISGVIGMIFSINFFSCIVALGLGCLLMTLSILFYEILFEDYLV